MMSRLISDKHTTLYINMMAEETVLGPEGV